MDHINGFKAAVAAVLGCLTALWGWFGWLVVAWVACMLLDYATGTAAGRPAGRGSLLRLSPLLAAGFTEAKLKLRIRRLAESGYISVGKTRQGLRLTLLGTEALAQGEV